jgi:hypothetical protein
MAANIELVSKLNGIGTGKGYVQHGGIFKSQGELADIGEKIALFFTQGLAYTR